MNVVVLQIAIVIGLISTLLIAVEVGFRLGRWSVRIGGDERAQLGTIQTAVLGMLGLLIGFSYSAAAGRFAERQGILVSEANAIGTAYLRSDLLPDPYRDQLRTCLRKYAAQRIELFDNIADRARIASECERLHGEMWDAARLGVQAVPAATMAVLPPVNEVIDLHTVRLSLQARHLPGAVLACTVMCAAITVAMVGYGAGQSKKRNGPLSIAMAILIAAMLWMTIDLDYPQAGLIRIDQKPMLDLFRSIGQ